MKQPPLISVIIPVYNAERYLAQALESVFAQKYDAFQIILVDDGSTDSSAQVAKDYGQRLEYLKQPNGGIGAALNAGIARARGSYLAFLDADDLWEPDKTSSHLEQLQLHPEWDMVFAHSQQFFSPDLEDPRRGSNMGPPQVARVTGTMLIRRPSFDRVGPLETDLKVGEFVSWMCRAQELSLAWSVLPQVLHRRRIHTSNQGKLHPRSRDYLKVLKAALDRRRCADRKGD